jgi:cytochrome P450
MPSPHQKHYTVSQLSGPPFIGLLVPALRDPLSFTMQLAHSHGDIISFSVLGQRGVQLNHPDLIRHVLVENHKNYRKSKPYIRFESAIGLGLLTSNGEKWKRDRQKIQPMFNRERTAGYYFEVASEVSEKYKRKWLALTENGATEINVTEEMAKITTEVILKSIFGRDIDDEAVLSLHHSYSVLIDYLRNIRLFPNVDMRKMFGTPAYFRFKKELANVDGRLLALAAKYRQAGLTDRYNMLALLIEAQKNDPAHFSDKDIRDHCVSMVFAGFESTSILMQWFWYMLDDREDIRRKLRENITHNAPCTATLDSTALSYESVQRMDYLSMVFKETMRLYPPFWMTGREPVEDDWLGDFKLAKGTTVVVPQLAMHRHPKWWENPNSFSAERFSPENEPTIDGGLYFPFSLGPRKCSGHMFVDMEAKTIIAKLLPFFDVTALNKVGNPMRPGISLKLKEPLRVRLSRHTPGASESAAVETSPAAARQYCPHHS